MFSTSPISVSIIQYFTLFLGIAGLFYFDFTIQNYLLILLGYFLYSGIGISMTMHRYLTHSSFEFSNKIVKWICIWFALMAGRGGIIPWVYIHRLHHAHSDTDKDPHNPNLSIRGMFFPFYGHFNDKINFRIVKDLLTDHIYIKLDKNYVLLIISWAILLLLIDIELLYFFWILPVALTHIVLNSFIYLGHTAGYVSHKHKDDSKNLWPFGILFWGEGWHNNHHTNPKNFKMGEKWWEIDLIAFIIKLAKK
jgi:sn-1 stearoyl-lipid 9-desaturase